MELEAPEHKAIYDRYKTQTNKAYETTAVYQCMPLTFIARCMMNTGNNRRKRWIRVKSCAIHFYKLKRFSALPGTLLKGSPAVESRARRY